MASKKATKKLKKAKKVQPTINLSLADKATPKF
jgi:hypothetical protein